MNSFRDIAQLVKERIGLDEQSFGAAAVDQAVRHRMEQRNFTSVGQYAQEVRSSEVELARLVDDLVVPESWFFRDQKPFQLLADEVARKRVPGSSPLRLLSAPCSSGEEPYSIAMTLLECGLPPAAFTIDAFDISERLLVAARGKTYRASSFRTPDLDFQKRFFERTPRGEFRFVPAIESSVRFHQANLVAPDFGSDLAPYDVIFCRNLFIYLDPSGRQQLLENMDRLLVPGGLLVVGHAEAGSIPLTRFEPARLPGSFGFFKRASRPAACFPMAGLKTENHLPEREPVRVVSNKSIALPGKIEPVPERIGESQGERRSKAEVSLAAIQTLADAGKLSEAAGLCAEYLRVHQACPKALYLLALIRMAEGARPEAEEILNRVLYLEPTHPEAILHLAHLAEARGEPALAQRWRQRLARLQKGG